MDFKLPKIVDRSRGSRMDRGIRVSNSNSSSKTPSYLSSTKSSSFRKMKKSKSEIRNGNSVTPKTRKKKRLKSHSSRNRRKFSSKKVRNNLLPLRLSGRNDDERMFSRSTNAIDNEFLDTEIREDDEDDDGENNNMLNNRENLTIVVDDDTEEDGFYDENEEDDEIEKVFLTELSPVHMKPKFAKDANDLIIDGVPLKDLKENRSERINELEEYITELKTKKDEEGENLVTFPKNYEQLINYMANKGKEEEFNEKEFEEYLKASELSDEEAFEDITEDNYEKSMSKIKKLDLILEEKESKLRDIVKKKKKKRKKVRKRRRKFKKLTKEELENVDKILDNIRKNVDVVNAFEIDDHDSMRLSNIDEELKHLKSQDIEFENERSWKENEKEIKKIIELQIENNI